jgi:hypothetical protein
MRRLEWESSIQERTVMNCPLVLALCNRGEFEEEGRAFSESRFDADVALQRIDAVRNDCEAKAQATGAELTIAVGMFPIEPRKDRVQVGVRYADPIVPYRIVQISGRSLVADPISTKRTSLFGSLYLIAFEIRLTSTSSSRATSQ